MAVSVREAWHEYGRWRRRGRGRRRPSAPETVLQGVNMTVRRGEVYALLGRSGCGKTTLLRALVGQLALDDGEVRVFGRAPGDPLAGVPGRAVGYMPQEVAVHDGFTVGETLAFFGRLMGMKSAAIRKSTDTLVSALRLPGSHELVGALSGGEKRRVSLAVAMLHAPPLLVLDEPTVGLDPLLRH
ncbi:ABC-transporter, subfamily H member 02, partial [Frankliniella occidentalis]